MDYIKFSILKPVTTIVVVILIALFGFISIYNMSYQLTPTVSTPQITVTTIWPSASPYDVESEILDEQEKVLKGVKKLKSMESNAYNSMAEIVLEFEMGTDTDKAMLWVSNKMDEVGSYPENVEKPIVSSSGASAAPAIWMLLKKTDKTKTSEGYKTFFENEVRQYIERVDGVSSILVFGGVEDELHVMVDIEKMASYGLTFDDVSNVLASENINVSAGSLGAGRKNYRIRTTGEFKTPKEISDTVIRSDGQTRIYLSDIATVVDAKEKPEAIIIHNENQSIVVGVIPENDANILDMTDGVEAVVKRLNAEVLNKKGLYFHWVYDQRPYINSAINLVKKNIAIGGILAIGVLLIFLRSATSTIVVATAIPISIIGTFIFLKIMGRSLNVVSLAGISFAVGMLVDNAIVVLENIDRHRGMGKSAFQASYDGTKEVWGAVLASTATTIAVFLPIIFMQEEAGQLFKDIAIAITASVSLSLFVSISVIPAFIYQLLRFKKDKPQEKKGAIDKFGAKVASGMMKIVNTCMKNLWSRVATIITLVTFSIVMTIALFPPMEYLPLGNQNLILNIFIPPPGLSYDERKEIGYGLFDKTKDMRAGKVEGIPAVENMFYVGSERLMVAGMVSKEPERIKELIPPMMGVVNSNPGIFGVSIQKSIFEDGIGGGRAIDVNISGKDLQLITGAAGMFYGMAMKELKGPQIRPMPSLEMSYPEINFIPDRDSLKASGMSSDSLGRAIDIIMDGRKVSEYKKKGEKKIDMILKSSASDNLTPEEISNSLLATPKGEIVPLYSLAKMDSVNGVQQIRHFERDRTITLQITPSPELAIEEAMSIINNKIKPVILSNPAFGNIKIGMSGTAGKLTEARQSLQWNFLLAAFIIYLLMASLFGSFLYPLIIIFSVPLAAAGGFIGLKLVNTFLVFQPMDILTMLGFIILIGTVVNNAILIVHQSLTNIREHGMDYKDAVIDSTKTRLRPIYMSATTSLFGMLPLVLAPGAGSELYRGLGGVVLGGLALSTIFTVFLIPAMLMFVIKFEKRKVGNE